MDRPSFFFSFVPALPERAPRPASGGLPSWGRPGFKKDLEVPVIIVQDESCLLSNDSPWHHRRSGRDWPDMWALEKLPIPNRTVPVYFPQIPFTNPHLSDIGQTAWKFMPQAHELARTCGTPRGCISREPQCVECRPRGRVSRGWNRGAMDDADALW